MQAGGRRFDPGTLHLCSWLLAGFAASRSCPSSAPNEGKELEDEPRRDEGYAERSGAGSPLDTPEHGYEILVDRYVVPGDPGTSWLIELLEGKRKLRMPPDIPLSDVDIALISAWIELGAEDN